MSIDVPSSGRVWAVVLAGGDGVRLRDLVRRGRRRPAQAVRRARRLALAAAPDPRPHRAGGPAGAHRDRDAPRQESHMSGALAGARVHGVLSQPENRGTAAAILFAADWIGARDPEAVVAVFPSDHFVLEEAALRPHLADELAVLDAHPDWLILLGAEAWEADPEYGWMELGATLAWTGNGEPISRVQRFWEKPSGAAAVALHEKGWLWEHVHLRGARGAALPARLPVPARHGRALRPDGLVPGHRARGLGAPAGVRPHVQGELLGVDPGDVPAVPDRVRATRRCSGRTGARLAACSRACARPACCRHGSPPRIWCLRPDQRWRRPSPGTRARIDSRRAGMADRPRGDVEQRPREAPCRWSNAASSPRSIARGRAAKTGTTRSRTGTTSSGSRARITRPTRPHLRPESGPLE